VSVRARSPSFPLGGVTSGMAVLRGIRAGITMTQQSAKSFGGRGSPALTMRTVHGMRP
jgi:hypothetical protein